MQIGLKGGSDRLLGLTSLNLAFKSLVPNNVTQHGNSQGDAASNPSQHWIVTALTKIFHP